MSTTISATLVKELRDATGARDDGREARARRRPAAISRPPARSCASEGMAQAAKRAGRATTEGIVGYRIEGDTGTMVAVGCETEPVSSNEEFQAFAKKVLEAVHADGPEAVESLEQERVGRRREARREHRRRRAPSATRPARARSLNAYAHPPANKIGVIVKLEGGSEELARQLAMHISFAAPEWTDARTTSRPRRSRPRSRSTSTRTSSRASRSRRRRRSSRACSRSVSSRLQPGGVLTEQPWIHDSAKTVGQALAEAGARVVAFKRLSVAE